MWIKYVTSNMMKHVSDSKNTLNYFPPQMDYILNWKIHSYIKLYEIVEMFVDQKY